MKRALQVIGLLVSFTTLVIAGTKVEEQEVPVTPFSLYVFAEPEGRLEQNPKAKLKGRDKEITRSAKNLRKVVRKQYSKWFCEDPRRLHRDFNRTVENLVYPRDIWRKGNDVDGVSLPPESGE